MKSFSDDAAYLVRKVELERYEVTKWSGSRNNYDSLYTVVHNVRRMRCSGPSKQCNGGTCRHARIVKFHVENPERDILKMIEIDE